MIIQLRYYLIFCALLWQVWQVSAQSALLSLSGTYGVLAIENPALTIDKGVAGIQAGLEYPFKKHFSFGGEIEWQSIAPYTAVAIPVSSVSGKPAVAYTVKNNQLSARIQARYYLNQATKGLYLGVFGTLLYQLTNNKGYPEDGAYPEINVINMDSEFRGGGISYGYRFQLNPSLGGHLFLLHQFLWNNINPDIKQQHHLVGIGLNYSF
jgi:hypothetical protein